MHDPESPPTAQSIPAAKEHLAQGNDFNQAGEFQKAVDEYQKALEIDPNYVDAMTNLGVALYHLGQSEGI